MEILRTFSTKARSGRVTSRPPATPLHTTTARSTPCKCKKFTKWMRSEYFFPIRVPIYFKNKVKLKCLDGDLAYGTCFLPDSYKDEPYIRIVVGDFPVIKEKWGIENALFSVFGILAHELTHDYQWINGLQFTQIGKERQASVYSKYITEEYSKIWDSVYFERRV